MKSPSLFILLAGLLINSQGAMADSVEIKVPVDTGEASKASLNIKYKDAQIGEVTVPGYAVVSAEVRDAVRAYIAELDGDENCDDKNGQDFDDCDDAESDLDDAVRVVKRVEIARLKAKNAELDARNEITKAEGEKLDQENLNKDVLIASNTQIIAELRIENEKLEAALIAFKPNPSK